MVSLKVDITIKNNNNKKSKTEFTKIENLSSSNGSIKKVKSITQTRRNNQESYR